MLPDTNPPWQLQCPPCVLQSARLCPSTPGPCLDTSMLALLHKFGYWECGFWGGQTETYTELGSCIANITIVTMYYIHYIDYI